MKLEKQLRLGNLIYGCYYNEDESDDELLTECEVLAIDLTGSSEYSIWVDSKANIEEFNNFQPIPLTEEWLLKMGFSKITFNHSTLIEYDLKESDLDVIYFDPEKPDNGFYWGSWKGGVNYVHQLQNLYFALTGEELTL